MSIIERLDEYAALVKAATPGPWQVGWGEDDDRSWVAFVHDLVEPNDLVVTASGDVGSTQYCEPDAAFIAASRSAVPALVEALRTTRTIIAHAIEDAQGAYSGALDDPEIRRAADAIRRTLWTLRDEIDVAIATALGVES